MEETSGSFSVYNADSPVPDKVNDVIVEDHPLVRRVLKRLLNEEPSLAVVGDAGSAEDALVVLAGTSPDVVLVDFSLPGMNGAELIEQLQRTHPEARCLAVSSYDENYYVDSALAAGARGYVVKGEPDVLLHAIAEVLKGHTVIELG